MSENKLGSASCWKKGGRGRERGIAPEHVECAVVSWVVGVYLGHGGVAPAVLSNPETFLFFDIFRVANNEKQLLSFVLLYAP